MGTINSNPFTGLTVAEITSLRTEFVQCISDIATAGKSYTIAGRTFTRADLDEVKETLKQLNEALAHVNGATKKARVMHPTFHNVP